MADDRSLTVIRAAVAEAAAGRAVTDETPLIQERILDSLSLLGLVARLEQELGVVVHDADILPDNFGSIRQIHTFVSTRSLRAS
ncbi:acyl carrier protein [Winogradskya humida]|uniref:Carrier domain-containing protein n=1 Tax=Winogradskya humida TaxID=113566 RepID=A0ABQ3ZZ15_9ACTN|nr:acyl carrier protein [Actinoplanes humidus]GIE23880.1 hypothetical protein Ahu01nite_069820 [Actinoplanes humidus]